MLVTKFTIYKVTNGYLLNVYWGKQKSEAIVYSDRERMTMFAKMDQLLGDEPDDAVDIEVAEEAN